MMTDTAANPVEDTRRWLAIQNALHEKTLAEAFVFLRANDIEPILIKGWAISRLYPELGERRHGDIDLAVSRGDYYRTAELLAMEENRRFGIDLHNELRHLDTVDYRQLFDRSKLIDLNGIPIRVLSEEDHLRVLCVHWLTDGGAYKDKLKDIHYAVERRGPDFDWHWSLNAAGETRKRWVSATILLSRTVYETRIEDTPLSSEEQVLPKWFIKAVKKEWSSDVRLQPIHRHLSNPQSLLKQIRKRIPPNPIQATIEMEGDFDNKPRVFYQIGNTLRRIPPMLSRVSEIILRKISG